MVIKTTKITIKIRKTYKIKIFLIQIIMSTPPITIIVILILTILIVILINSY